MRYTKKEKKREPHNRMKRVTQQNKESHTTEQREQHDRIKRTTEQNKGI
jgi:hypothetical protein